MDEHRHAPLARRARRRSVRRLRCTRARGAVSGRGRSGIRGARGEKPHGPHGDAAVLPRADAMRFTGAREPHVVDVAFAAPTYRLSFATRLAALWLEVPFARILGIEHRIDEVLPGPGDRGKYGDTAVTLYRA